MYTPGLDDEVLMIVPYVLVPLQLYFISSITKQTPFIVRQSLKLFVRKYVLYVTFLMSMQCMQVAIVVFGSREPMFFDYDTLDGFKTVRIVSRFNKIKVILDLYYVRPLYFCLFGRLHYIRASVCKKVLSMVQKNFRLFFQ